MRFLKVSRNRRPSIMFSAFGTDELLRTGEVDNYIHRNTSIILFISS